MSLRARLLIGLVALVAIGLGAAAITTYEEQRSFLFQRLDQQVVASELPVSVGIGLLRPRGPTLTREPPFPLRQEGLPARPETTFQASGTYGELLDGNGRLLRIHSFTYGGTAASPPALPGRFPVSRTTTSGVHLFTVHSRSGSGLRYRAAAFSVSQNRILVIAVPLRDVDQTLHRLIVVEGLVGSGVIIALVALGWMVIRLGLRPLERMERVASDISHGDLSRRVSSANPRTEVGRLGASLNEMMVQIERAFADRSESEDRLRRFLADASHELRTPLAAIRGYAELFGLGAVTDRAGLEHALARIEAESARMGVLVEDLLLLASLDELPEVRRQAVDLCELVEQAAQDTRAIAPDRKIRLTINGPLPVRADSDQLRQVMANLTRNALIHTPAGSPIDLEAYGRDGYAVVTVRDHGPGLPMNSGDRVFERFWRTERGRSRGRGGAGLGLAIVKAIVEAHHGDVHTLNADDGGAEFVVRIPTAAALLAHRDAAESVGTRG